MKKKIVTRLMVMLLTASILLSSTGIYTLIASAESPVEQTTSSVQGDEQKGNKPSTNANLLTEGGELRSAGARVVTEGGALVAQNSIKSAMTGTGTVADPYLIANVADFASMQGIINDTTSVNKYFKLMADLDLSTYDYTKLTNNYGFRSIVSLNPVLAVVYPSQIFFNLDGNGKTISNFKVKNEGASTCGLLGYLSPNTIINNLTFSNCNLTTPYQRAAVSAVVVIQNAGTISNCTFNNLSLAVTSSNIDLGETITLDTDYLLLTGNGVICGSNLGTITAITVNGVTANITGARKYVSVVAAQNKGTITSSTVSGVSISSTTKESMYTGVLTSYNYAGATVSNSTVNLPGTQTPIKNNISVVGTTVGGIAGYNAGSVTGCTIKGDVTNVQSADGASFNMAGAMLFGGIVAENAGTVNTCSSLDMGMYFNAGAETTIYGGIVGKNTSSVPVSNCIATGDIGDTGLSGYSTIQAGGILGQAANINSRVKSCYALVSLSTSARDSGAIIGRNGSVAMLTDCYWSSEISGRSNACTYNDGAFLKNDLSRSVNVVNIGINSSKTINKTMLIPSWGGATIANAGLDFTLGNGTNMTIAQTANDFTITGGANNGVSDKIDYKVNITIPVGIGASTAATVLLQQFSVPVLQTQTALDQAGVSASNPILISSDSEFALMKQARYAHYKLTQNIIAPIAWSPFIFNGTLNGDGKTVTVSSTLFTGVYGNRDANTTAVDWKTGAANLSYGYVKNINIVLNFRITSSIFGRAYNSTFDSVNLSALPGGSVDATSSNTGSFINVLEGNNYVYNCNTSIDVRLSQKSVSTIGGFIGEVTGSNGVIDNCGSKSNILTLDSYPVSSGNPSSIAGFIGAINKNAVITNCYASGRLSNAAFSHVVIGNQEDGAKVSNVYWSLNSTKTDEQPIVSPAKIPTGYVNWSFDQSMGTIGTSGTSSVTLTMPKGLNLFAGADLSKLEIAADATQVTIVSTVFEGETLDKLNITFSAVGDVCNTVLTVTHPQTGLKARIGIISGFSKDANGYNIISSREELIYLNTNYPRTSDNLKYATLTKEKYIVTADIDMRGYDFVSMGNGNTEALYFSGEFVGANKPGGGRYTISNLSISKGSGQFDVAAMFQTGVGCKIRNINFENSSSISDSQNSALLVGYATGDCQFTDIGLNNVSVAGGANLGALVGFAEDKTVSSVPYVSSVKISNVSVNGLKVTSTGNFVGGLIGRFFGSGTLQIGADAGAVPTEPNVNIRDLNVAAISYVGGVLGSAGNLYNSSPTSTTSKGLSVINGVSISRTGAVNCVVSGGEGTGSGYVGGMVGSAGVTANSVMKNCTIRNTDVTNASTALNPGITGGFAATYQGTIDNCNLYDSKISGMVTAGIMARTSSAVDNVMVSNCSILGNTIIEALPENNTSASGIVGQHNRMGSKVLSIENCNVGSAVKIGGGTFNAGILGAHNAASQANLTSVVSIKSCKSYATITSGTTSMMNAGTGGIVGLVQPINSFSITDCVVAGKINGSLNTGGIIGAINAGPMAKFNNGTNMQQQSIEGYIVNNSYVSAKIAPIEGSAGGNFGMVLGNSTNNMNFFTGTGTSFVSTAFRSVVCSSYSNGVVDAFGCTNIKNAATAIDSFIDVNRPVNLGEQKYVNSLTEHVRLTNQNRSSTVTINNLSNSSAVSDFAFVTNKGVNGWFAEDSATLSIDSAVLNGNTPSTIGVTATEYNPNNAAYIDYAATQIHKADGTTVMSVSDPENSSAFVLQISVPINCDIQDVLDGTGTASDPYLIRTKSNLIKLSQYVESNYTVDNGTPTRYLYAKLVSNIAYTPAEKFIPIGRQARPFYGEFDGEFNATKHTISGISLIDDSKDYLGLFGYAKDSVFKNITVTDFTVNPLLPKLYAGSVLAYGINVKFSNINASNIKISNINVVGGIIGHAHMSTLPIDTCSMKNIAVSGVKLDALVSAGGIAGEFVGTVGDSAVTSGYDVIVNAGVDSLGASYKNTVTALKFAGGVVGRTFRPGEEPMKSAYCRVKVTDTDISVTSTGQTAEEICAGGLLGFAMSFEDDLLFSDCYIDEGITVTGTHRNLAVGGVIGASSSAFPTSHVLIRNTTTFAKVSNNSTTTTDQFNSAGGIVGYIRNPRTFNVVSSVAGGVVKSTVNVGGTVGYIWIPDNAPSSYTMADPSVTQSMVSDTVISATIIGAKSVGRIFGSIDYSNTIFPNASGTSVYYVEPFKNIYYSSHGSVVNFVGDSILNSSQGYLLYDSNTGTGKQTSFQLKYYDLNKVKYIHSDVPLGKDWIQVQNTDVIFDFAGVTNIPNITGGFQSFVVDDNVNFVIDSKKTSAVLDNAGAYKVLTAEDILLPEFSKFHAGDHVMRATIENTAGNMIVKYSNGLAIEFTIQAFGELEGTGSVETPYVLKTVNHFSLLRAAPDKNFILGANVSFAAEGPWEPIENFTGTFSGLYKGVYYSVDGMKINQPTENDLNNTGLFKTMRGEKALVKDLTLSDFTVSGMKKVGALTGSLIEGATLDNVVVKNSKVQSLDTAATNTSPVYTGGVVGYADISSKILNCTVESSTIACSEALFTNNKFTWVGGIVGVAANVSGCKVRGTVGKITEISGGLAGGILGSVTPNKVKNINTLSNCIVEGSVNIIGVQAGGIMGQIDAMDNFLNVRLNEITVSGCVVNSAVYVNGRTALPTDGVGGIIGCATLAGPFSNVNNQIKKLKILNCQSYATVSAETNTGGILGLANNAMLDGNTRNKIVQQLYISGCVGSGTVINESTAASYGNALTYRGNGAIIGRIAALTGGGANRVYANSTIVSDCISSAKLISNKATTGYIVGELFTIDIRDSKEAVTPVLFENICYSSYQQKNAQNNAYQPIGDTDIYTDSITTNDVAYYDNAGTKASSFLVKNFAQENPGASFNTVALAPYMSDKPQDQQQTYIVPVSIRRDPVIDSAGIDLGLVNSTTDVPPILNSFMAAGLNVKLDGFTLDSTAASVFTVSVNTAPEGNVHSVKITPSGEGGGYLEAILTGGLKVGVMLLSFEILGQGTETSPFQVPNAKTLKIISDLPYDFYWKQTADINITSADYETGGVFYDEGNRGFTPIGSSVLAFVGNYDGNGKKITGVYINRPTENDVGVFGKVGNGASLKNIHIEISEMVGLSGIIGKNNVGGLAGSYSSAGVIDNCSVAFGTVSAKNFVGGLVGLLDGKVNASFTNLTVYNTGYLSGEGNNYDATAGGIVGEINGAALTSSEVKNSFSASLVHSAHAVGGIVGHVAKNSNVLIENCFFTGSASNGTSSQSTILVGNDLATYEGIVTAKNVYAAGTNVHFKNDATLFSHADKSALNTGSQNVYYDSDMLGTLASKNPGVEIPISNAVLTNGTAPSGFSAADWTFEKGSYPKLNMKDAYSNSFCSFATTPITYDSRDTTGGSVSSDGILFPLKIKTEIGGKPISVVSSTYSASFGAVVDSKTYKDTLERKGFDFSLYGNGESKCTDLLFKKNEDGYTYTYRNVFGKNVGEIPYQTLQTPVATYETTINGVTVKRIVRVPYVEASQPESGTYCFYISTERQLRAIMDTAYNEPDGTKYAYYRQILTISTDMTVNVYITADIELSGSNFTPISNFRGDLFEGNGCTISRLRISAGIPKVGFFNELTYPGYGDIDKMKVQNISFENVEVIGRNVDYVGILAGRSDAKVLINNCNVVYNGSVENKVSGNDYVGGLIGKADSYIGYSYDYSKSTFVPTDGQSSGVNVRVEGRNFVGGFVGYSTKGISHSFANGNVIGKVDADSITYIDDTNTSREEPRGVGGFVGVAKAKIDYSFASCNVSVDQIEVNANYSKLGIGGFVGYMAQDGENTSSILFSSGKVNVKGIYGNLYSTEFGVGGLVGLSDSPIGSCYSSATVNVDYGVANTTSATIGIGGVAGISNKQINDAYSSGYVDRVKDGVGEIDPLGTKTIGGAVGNATGAVGATFTQIYFDRLNNNDQNITAIGGRADVLLAKGIDTKDFFGDTMDKTKLGFDTTYWGVNNAAYPYLKDFFRADVSNWIKYPAVLSVIAVTPNSRDTSANNGRGISMAVQMPSMLKISGVDYNLTWTPSNNSGTGIIFLGNNIYTPVRTANIGQSMDLIAQVKNNEQYGSREYERQCADMLGTQENPYLIASKLDLQHVGQIPSDIPAEGTYPNFYDQWISPINLRGENYTGKIYYRLMSDVDMRTEVTLTPDGNGGYTIAIVKDSAFDINDSHCIKRINIGTPMGPDETTTDPNDKVSYQGMVFDGYDFAIENFTSTLPFAVSVEAGSEIKDVVFENISITNSNGQDIALVQVNSGKIDGVVVRNGGGSRTFSTTGNAAGIAVENNGDIVNSIADATISAGVKVGGIAVANKKQIIRSASACDITTSAVGAANIGGLVGTNDAGATITDSFAFGSIGLKDGSTASSVGGFVGTNSGLITNAFTKANTTGYDTVGAFAGTNNGSIVNAYAAGAVKVTNPSSVQNTVFSGSTGTGASTSNVAFDKSMAGSSLYGVKENALFTEDMVELVGFEDLAKSKFTIDIESQVYPQLSNIVNITTIDTSTLDVAHNYELLKSKLLKAYSNLCVSSINTAYAQFVDTLAVGSENVLSNVANVKWAASDPGIIIVEPTKTVPGKFTLPSASGTANLNYSLEIEVNADTHKKMTVDAALPIAFGGRNPNFAVAADKTYGDGSAVKPYLIDSNSSFESLSYYGRESNTSYKLVKDLNYNGLSIEAIKKFKGIFDGDRHAISDVTISNNNGLFGDIIGGTVKNLALMGINMTAKVDAALPVQGFGLLAGSVQDVASKIENCSVIGNLHVTTLAPEKTALIYAGGLVGYVGPAATISSCATSGKVVSDGDNAKNAVGGIAGYVDTANVNDVMSTAYVLGIGSVGGIIGVLTNESTLTNASYAGSALDASSRLGASVSNGNNVGNIVGRCAATVTNANFDTSFAVVDKFIGKTETSAILNNFLNYFTEDLVEQPFDGWQKISPTDYNMPANLCGDVGASLYKSANAFISMPIELLSSKGVATIFSFEQVNIPVKTSVGDSLTAVEIPKESTLAKILTSASTGTGTLFTLPGNLIDTSAVFTGISVKMGSSTNDISRYVEPRLSRTINVTYSLLNSTADSSLNSKTVSLLVKNRHGGTSTSSSDVLTNAGEANKPVLDAISVSSNRFYIGMVLPNGYKYKVSLLKDGAYVECPSMQSNEYGTCVDISSIITTNDISIKIEMISINPAIWGLKRTWNSLFNNSVS